MAAGSSAPDTRRPTTTGLPGASSWTTSPCCSNCSRLTMPAKTATRRPRTEGRHLQQIADRRQGVAAEAEDEGAGDDVGPAHGLAAEVVTEQTDAHAQHQPPQGGAEEDPDDEGRDAPKIALR